MRHPNHSYKTGRSPASRVGLQGNIEIAVCPAGTFRDGDSVSVSELSRRMGVRVIRTHNLESDYVLTAIAKSLTGEAGGVGSGANITPTSMAIGNSAAEVTSSMTALASEIIRKPVTLSRAGSKVLCKVTLASGEALGSIGSLALMGADDGSGNVASGSISLSGTPKIGDGLVITLDGKAIPTYWVASTTLSTVVSGLTEWLNSDGDFGALYNCSVAGNTVSLASKGKGTVYNKPLGASSTGVVSVSSTGCSGGTTPGGNLLAAANASFKKERNTQLLIEWTIAVTN
jgi:hypothetical protein